jgi:hypothetical protein
MLQQLLMDLDSSVLTLHQYGMDDSEVIFHRLCLFIKSSDIASENIGCTISLQDNRPIDLMRVALFKEKNILFTTSTTNDQITSTI